MLPLPDDLKKKYLTEDGNDLTPAAPTYVPVGFEVDTDILNRLENEILLGNGLNHEDSAYAFKAIRLLLCDVAAAEDVIAAMTLKQTLAQALGGARIIGL